MRKLRNVYGGEICPYHRMKRRACFQIHLPKAIKIETIVNITTIGFAAPVL